MKTGRSKEANAYESEEEEDANEGISLVADVIKQRYPGKDAASKNDDTSLLGVPRPDAVKGQDLPLEVTSPSSPPSMTAQQDDDDDDDDDDEDAPCISSSAWTILPPTIASDPGGASTAATASTGAFDVVASPGAFDHASPGAFDVRADATVLRRQNIRRELLQSDYYPSDESEQEATTTMTTTSTTTTNEEPTTTTAASSNTLVQANPVDATAAPSSLPHARPFVRRKTKRGDAPCGWPNHSQAYVVLAAGCAALIFAMIVNMFVANTSSRLRGTTIGANQATSDTNNDTTNNNSDRPTLLLDLAVSLPPHSIQAIQDNKESPQHQAYLWMQQDPYLSNYSHARLVQRFALATIYHALGGLQWTHAEGWMSYEIHECDWLSKGGYGFDLFSNDEELVDANWRFELLYRQVGPAKAMATWAANVYPDTPPPICDKQDQYTKLYLYNNNLAGQIPEELYLLTTLQSMDIGVNSGIQGTLSTNIGQLQQLQFVWHMWLPALTGTLPTEVGLLTNMKLFNILSSMDGPLPSELGNMQSLVDISLPRSKFTGTIPVELTKLTRLSRLTLAGNAMTGSFPSEIGLLTNLRVLRLDTNLFTGSLPTQLDQLSKLISCTVHSNLLSGTLPKEIAQWTNLIYAELSDNHLSGQLPAAIGQWTQLLTLQVANNMFTGSLPGELALLTALEELDVSSNSFVGEVPLELDQLSQLKIFNLQANDLTSVPQLSLVHNLTHLHLDSNPSLGGSVNDFLLTNATFPLLQAVTLANTGLTGELPMQLCPIEELIYDCSPQLCGCNCSCSS